MSTSDDLSQYDVLSKRILALDTDIARELDSEKRLILEDRRMAVTRQRDEVGSRLALATYQRTDGHLSQTPDVADEMIDARITTTEATLRQMNDKMDKLIDQVHDIDTRQRLLEAQVVELKSQIGDVRNQVVLIRTLNTTDLPRAWLLAGVISVLVALMLLVLITWRVMGIVP